MRRDGRSAHTQVGELRRLHTALRAVDLPFDLSETADAVSTREELANQITRMKVLSSVVQGRVTVTEQEVQQLFDERYGSQAPGLRVRVRHILIPWPDEPTEEKRARMREIAETIRQRAIESGAFAGLARQYSRAPSAADGGLSTFKEGEVAPEIAEYVFGLPAGEITPVIETAHGLNIFQIVNRFDPADIQYDDVADLLNDPLNQVGHRPAREARDEQCRRRVVDLVRSANLLDPTLVDHGDPVAHDHRLLLIMGHKQRCRAKPRKQLSEFQPEHRTEFRIEVG